jgi:hypothetical protein
MVPFRTFASFGLALGMLGVGYLFAPAPGAQPMPAPAAKADPPPAPPKPESTLQANRPPVPLLTPQRTTYYTPPPDKPEKTDRADKTERPATEMALKTDVPTDNPTGDGAQAKRAIEFDGYKNVRALVKGPDGIWRGRAMRGRTEIAVKVDATGNVSAE